METIFKCGVWKIEQSEKTYKFENYDNYRYFISNNWYSSELHIYYNSNWTTDYLKITNQKVIKWIDKLAKKINFERAFNNMRCLPLFEIEVLNRKENEEEFLQCDIKLKNNYLIAYRNGLTKKELRSKYVANTSIKIDYDFSLDENLQELYEKVQNEIINSELYFLV